MHEDAFRMFDLTGRTAVVTAGGTGIGYYMARGLARSGAKVMIAARRESVLKESAARLRAETGGEIHYRTVDLQDRVSIAAFCEEASSILKGVDIFVGNAALSQELFEPLDTIVDASIDAYLQVNLSSIVEMMRAFLPHMRAKKWGRIIFSSSGTSAAPLPQAGMVMYTATKGALNSIARTAACEVGHDGITVNSVLYGMYMTEQALGLMAHLDAQNAGAGKAFESGVASMTALGRTGRVDEPEGVIQFLASDAASYVTGANIVVDGGNSIIGAPNAPPSDPVYPPLFS